MTNMPSHRRVRKGFSLVKLVGAIAVVAILTALAAPSLMRGPEQNKIPEIAPHMDLEAAISGAQRASEVLTNANNIAEDAIELMKALE
jgi:Tfp pilus assembly protein FimT